MRVFRIYILLLLSFLLAAIDLSSQNLIALYHYENDAKDLRAFLFNRENNTYVLPPIENHYLTQEYTIGDSIYYHLSCMADFNGDGIDELALFTKKIYNPYCMSAYSCPPYSMEDIQVMTSAYPNMVNKGSRFSKREEDLDFSKIISTTAAYFNSDSLADITFLYQDNVDTLSLRILSATANGFEELHLPYTFPKDSIFPDSVLFIKAADFNADSLDDIALITEKSVRIFANTGSGFSVTKKVYALPDSLTVLYALAAQFTLSPEKDLALVCQSANTQSILLLSFGADSLHVEKDSLQVLDSALSASKIMFAAATDVNADGLADIHLGVETSAVFPNVFEIMLMKSQSTYFETPISYFSTTANEFNFHKLAFVDLGDFSHPDIAVCRWKNNKASALTFSFDDGFSSTIEAAKYLYTKGIRGSQNIVPNLSGTANYADWALIENDTLGNEYASHSNKHNRLNQISLSAAKDELLLSKADIESHVHSRVNSFVFPGGGFSYDVMQLPELRDNYLSARTSMNGYNMETPSDFYALKAKVIVKTTPVVDVEKMINATEYYGFWTFLMFHYFDYKGSNPDYFDYDYSSTDFQAIVDYAITKNVWIDTQESITKYVKERNAATIYDYANNASSLSFRLEDGLADSVYNVPLTVRVPLPNAWLGDSVSVMQNAVKTSVPTVTEGAMSVVYIDVLADSTEILIEEASPVTEFENYFLDNLILDIYPNPANNASSLSFRLEDGLADSVYNVPLTVRVPLPDAWSGDSVTVMQNALKTSFPLVTEGAMSVVYIDVLADSTEILIEEASPVTEFENYFLDNLILDIYPNPANDYVRVNIDAPFSAGYVLNIADSQGRKIRTINIVNPNNIGFSVNSYPQGVYTILLLDRAKIIARQKLIVY